MEYLKELLWSVHGMWHYSIRLWVDLHGTSWLSNNSPSSTAPDYDLRRLGPDTCKG